MILGLIGGAGSGKSTASEILENDYGYRVLQTDNIAKRLMNEDAVVKEKLKQAFGSSIYTEGGQLDRKAYAELIYSNPENRKRSDAIVHPAVWAETLRLLKEEPGHNTVIETALPGPQLRRLCDKVIFVQTDPNVRIDRMMKNRNYTRAYAESILRNQKDDAFFAGQADLVISNNKGMKELKEAIASDLVKKL